ncbi:oligosaccharide flippase family protein [Solirubrobacter soli]|uniref:oligosaccharide flippase family protein n=1 Tax=Solirubrobacter soli TaxID=363832 RepID=UPI000405FCAE|nr:oligosaccharide flippase family protein [Solirubrobacter soli]
MSASLPEPELDLGATSAPAIVSGGLWTLLSRVLPQAQLLVLSIVVARYLGPDEMGRQSYIAFVALTLVQAATAGLPGAVSRFVGELLGARRGGAALSIYRLTRRIEVLGAILVMAVIAIAVVAGSAPRTAWILAGVSAALSVLQAVPAALLMGAQRWREAWMPGLVTGVATVPAVVVALELGGGISGLFAVEAVAVFINLVWTSVLARRIEGALAPASEIDPELRRRFWSFAASTSVIVIISFVVWRRSELFILQHYSGDAQIAFYSIAFAAVSGLSKLPETVETVTMPAVANLMGTGQDERIRRGFWRALRLLVLATFPLVAGMAVAGPALLELAYGSDYSDAGPVLLAMLAPLLVQPMLRVSEGVLYGLGRPMFIVYAGLAATVVDVALAFLLIPSLDAVGAAIANGAAVLVAGVPCLWVVASLYRPVVLPFGAMARAVLVSLAVAAGAFAGLEVGALAAVLVGAILGMAAALVVRPLSGEDAAWLAGALGDDGARGRAAGFVRRLGSRS